MRSSKGAGLQLGLLALTCSAPAVAATVRPPHSAIARDDTFGTDGVQPGRVPRAEARPSLPFESRAFERAQAEGRTVIVETYAYWCLTCRIQSPILDRLRQSEAYSDIVVFRVGEETPGRVWKQFHLTGYGTLVLFKGRREIARGTPLTEAAVSQLLQGGL